MSSANRTQIASVVESTLGTTPGTPRMRLRTVTGESLNFSPTFVDPIGSSLRSHDGRPDPDRHAELAAGSITSLTTRIRRRRRMLIFSRHSTTPGRSTNSRDNDGTADSVITNVATASTVLTVTTGTSLTAKALYRFTGFGVTGNNGVFACTTASATVPRFVGSGITDEAVPPAAARVKEVGFIGDSGDINATSTGLSSTTTDFTTFAGLAVGKWIKIGGTGAVIPFRDIGPE
jgi:hypothetical protein